jgi:hypothetical protein
MGSIKLTQDYGFVLGVLNDPEMLERICEGGQSFEFTLDLVRKMGTDGYLLGWYVDNEIKGFYWIHPYTASILQIHAHFPIENRAHSTNSGEAMLAWLRTNSNEQYQKYMAMIPVCYPDVIGFSVREGLVKEGVLSKAFAKGGNMIDLVILGASREA